MPTPPVGQGAPTRSSSPGGAASSASASPSCSWDPSSCSPSSPACSWDPSSSSPPAPVPTGSSGPPHAAASSSSGRRGESSAPSPPPPSCAACRHQRPRCPPDCLLKPYFVTTDEPDKFRNALRMFGVKNLHRILREVPPPRRDVCVRTIIYESDVRAADPVRGCCGVIQDLEDQLMDTAVELVVLRRRLESYRQMTHGPRGSWPPNHPLVTQQQPSMARTSDDGMQPQGGPCGVPVPPAANGGPCGVPVSPAANELTATQPRLSATEMEPRSSQVQPQLSTMRP